MDCWEKEIRPATCAKYIDHIYKVAPVVIAVDGRATADLPRKLFLKYNNKHYYDCFAKNNIKTTII
jgi:hypothetical protein